MKARAHFTHTRALVRRRAHARAAGVRGATCPSCRPGGHQIEFRVVNAHFAAVMGTPDAFVSLEYEIISGSEKRQTG